MQSTHEMRLYTSPFEMIKNGTKNIELRLYDEKRQRIKTGDDIIFTNTATGERMCATVKALHLFNSFQELYQNLPLLQCGYTTEDVDTAHPSDMQQYYSAEEQRKYGVVGIELFPPKTITDHPFIESVSSKQKTDYLILVNKHHRLPDHFEDTLELISVTNAEGISYTIEKKTYEAFLRLQADLLQNDGIQAELISVYRNVEAQEKIFENYKNKFGLEYAIKYAAKPGHSEHHTGFAIDVGFLLDGQVTHGISSLLQADHLFQIVHKKLPKYGFLLRYPQGKEAVTEIGYEPWHFRYIDSPEIAKEMAEKGLCLEEYLLPESKIMP